MIEKLRTLDDSTLRALYSACAQEINERNRAKSQKALFAWRPGMLADFTGKDGMVRRIQITQRNQRTVSGVEVSTSPNPLKRWKVDGAFLRQPTAIAKAA
jgi:hypothetical protein